MRLRFLGFLLILLPLLAPAQQLCGPDGLRAHMKNGGWGVVDERDTVLIAYDKRPLVVLTHDLVKVSLTYTQSRWGLLDRQGRAVLPMEYEELEAAGCDYIQGRKGNESFLFDRQGQVVYKEAGHNRFAPYAQFNRLVVSHIGTNQFVDAIRILDLRTKKPVYAQNPSSGAYALHMDVTVGRGPQKFRLLPFFEVSTTEPGSGGSRVSRKVLDLQGKMLFDSIDAGIDVWAHKLVYLRSRTRPLILTDTLLKPIKFLSYKYNSVVPIGPKPGWWAVSRGYKSGIVDGTGKVILPVTYAGQLTYAGDNNYLLSEYRNRIMFYSLITADRRVVDLGEYYLGHGPDSTLAKQPLLLKHQKTYKYGLLDPRRGFILPVRYEVVEPINDGYIFFQQDSAGYLDSQGRLRRLTSDCQVLSAYSEGYAVCGKLVPNASRSQFPSAHLVTSAQGTAAAQYAYMNANGQLISGYFDWVGPFHDGYATVLKDNDLFMIDPKGQKVTFDQGLVLVTYFRQGLAVVRQGNLFGLVDTKGRLVLPAEYRSIATESLNQGSGALVSRTGRGNALQPLTAPRLTDGMVEVVTADGKTSRVPVPVGK